MGYHADDQLKYKHIGIKNITYTRTSRLLLLVLVLQILQIHWQSYQ